MDAVEVLRLIFGTVFVLFLQEFAWSYVFFGKDEIDWIERIALIWSQYSADTTNCVLAKLFIQN